MITIAWGTKVINVPKADTTLVQSGPPEIRELDLNTFRQALLDLQDDADGMASVDTHRHTAPTTLAGVTFARVVEVINGFTVTFENGSYAVNIINGNSNLGSVVNRNSVGVNTANSGGLVIASLDAIAALVWATQVGAPAAGTFGKLLQDTPANVLAREIDSGVSLALATKRQNSWVRGKIYWDGVDIHYYAEDGVTRLIKSRLVPPDRTPQTP